MSQNYDFSITNDFSNGVDTSLLKSEILTEAFTPNFLRIDTIDDNLSIVSDFSLSVPEETILNNLISTHIPKINGSGFLNTYITTNKLRDINYSRIGILYYDPNNLGNIESIGLSVKPTQNITSFDIRVINIETATIVFNKNFISNNNFISTYNDNNVLSPVTSPSNLEISAKINGTSLSRNDFLEIYSISIFHN